MDIIDLTNSFTLSDHCTLANIIIDLDSDDSIVEDRRSTSQICRDSKLKKSNCTSSQYKGQQLCTGADKTAALSKFGHCPICWEELGKNPLVSTICGHVYCLKCLEQSLQFEKRCPTCRASLKRKSAYHPLYLFK